MSDLARLTELKNRIDFLRNSTSEAELIHAIEQELTTFCEFQITFNKFNKTWEYYIRCDVRYTNSRVPDYVNKLQSLYESINMLVTKGV